MRQLIVTVGLGLGLVASSGVALAQETINADGSNVTSTAGVNPVAEAEGPTIVYGDLNPGPGTNVIGPPAETTAAPPPAGTIPSPEGTVGDIEAGSGNASTLGPGSASAAPGTVTEGSTGTALLGPDGTYSVSEVSPSTITTGDQGAPAPVAAAPVEAAPVEAAPVEAAPVEAAPVEAAPAAPADATALDSDADNLVDSLEAEYGLDPYNADSDADGVADGDEINIYGTDPSYGDSDGDGVLDGEELFGISTDPLVWDDFSAEAAATGAA
jgi:hypothetical protein